MQVRIRHLTGSKAGLEQTFDSEPIRIGRDPSSDVAFDIEKDILVSAHHAELAFDGRRWVVRDLGSTNGTWVDGERVKTRPLMSGDSLQLGERGPKLQIAYEQESEKSLVPGDRSGTGVMSVNDLLAGGSQRQASSRDRAGRPTVDGTTMLSADELAAVRREGAPAAGASDARPPRKTAALRSVLLAALIVVTMLIVVAIVGKKPAVQTTNTEVPQRGAESEKLRNELAVREAELDRLRQQMQTPAPNTSTIVSADLERQYRGSQEMIDRLRRELEQKDNELRHKKEQLASAESRPPKTIVRYVPVPQQPTVPVSKPALTVKQESPPPIAAPPSSQLPANNPAQPRLTPPQPVVTETQAPAPAVVAPRMPATTTAPRPAVVPAPAPTVAAAPEERLQRLKSIRKRVSVSDFGSSANGVPSEVAAELARSIGAALSSTRAYLVDRNAPLAVRVTMTNYHAKADPKLNTNRTVGALRGIGAILGKNLPNVPAAATMIDFDGALAATITIYDPQGRQIASASPQSALQQTRSSVDVSPAHVSFGSATAGDTPIADAFRQVVGGATDEVLSALASTEGEVTITSAHGQSVAIDGGRNANVAPDDVFDIFDAGRGVARIRIDVVQDSTATATVIWGEAAGLNGKRGRYAGTPVTAAPADSSREERMATVREKVEWRDGPGKSFRSIGALQRGNRVRLLYTVGPWSRIQSASTSGWVTSSAIDVQ